MNAAIQNMQNIVTSCMLQKIKIETDKKKARRGIVRGGSVTVGEKSYPYIPVVDMYFTDGDTVWCIVDDSQNNAIVVGM